MSRFARLKALLFRSRLSAEVEEELASHIEMRTADNISAGMSPEEARRDARLRFGNTTATKEKVVAVDAALALESAWADLKYGLRQALKSPGFSAVCVLTVALGIGANAAVFSVIDAVILHPLPYANAARLIDAQSVDSNTHQTSTVSYPDFLDWRARNRTLQHLVSYRPASYTVTGAEHPIEEPAEVVSWDLLPMLGVNPEIGRGFTSDEERPGTRVVLISHDFWMSQFGGAKSILGKPIELSGKLFTVIGVMPASFRFPLTAPGNGIWTTSAVDNDPAEPGGSIAVNRGFYLLNVAGEMKPGIKVLQVSQDLGSIAMDLAKGFPDTNAHRDSVRVQTELSALLGDTRNALLLVQGSVALVLLIACANIANLLLTRIRERQRELAMRTALGAGRSRIVRQLLMESLLLGVAGGLAGCGLAYVCTPLVLSLVGASIPRAASAGVNLRVLTFATLASIASGILVGIIPAITASSTDLISNLKEYKPTSGTGRDWLRSSLIVGQIAIGLMLTTSTGLLFVSFVTLRQTNEGFKPDHLLTLLFVLPDSQYRDKRASFYREYFDKVRALPGVESAAGTINLPMTDYSDARTAFDVPEHPTSGNQRPTAAVSTISSDYFRTMQIPVRRGRDFSDHDNTTSPQVVIVSRTFAERYFPGHDIIGKKVRPDAGEFSAGGFPWREIVGVVGDVHLGATQLGDTPEMYVPASQLIHNCCLYTVIRTHLDSLTLEKTVAHLVGTMNADLPITEVSTMQDLMAIQLSQPRFTMILMGTFAALAMVLTIVGLYGVMMYSVSRRTREIGVRMALGAQRSSVLSMVLRDAAILLVIGISVGLVLSLVSTSVIQSMLYGTGARNPAVFAIVSIMVALAGVIAAYIPASRAASIDPTQALRSE